MPESVIKISIDGKTYKDITKYLSLDSDEATLKTIINSKQTISVPGDHIETVIPHGLGYPAFYQVLVDVNNSGLYRYPVGGGSLFWDTGSTYSQMEQNNLRVFVTNTTASSIPATIRYMIMARNIV